MLKNENIVCISSIDWDFIWQTHHEIVSELAEAGNKVLFIDNLGVRAPLIRDLPRVKKRFLNWRRGISGIRKEGANIFVYSPLIVPFPYSKIARVINKYILLRSIQSWFKVMNIDRSIVWTFLPTPIALDLINSLNKKITIYHCLDDFEASSWFAKRVRKSETTLLKSCDLTFTSSRELYHHCAQYAKNVYLFPAGVNFRRFRKDKEMKPSALDGIKGPIVGYVGGIHKWLDNALLEKLIKANPDLSFVFVGPIQTDISILSGMSNVYFIGTKRHYELPQYINFFDVSIIPYLCTEYTKSVYPIKLNEYLAMGKPVVSTDLPEIRIFNEQHGDIIYIGRSDEEFSTLIKKAIEENNQELRNRRVDIAKENSWQSRIEQMSVLIEEAVEKKRLDKEARWKEGLLTFYRFARRRFVRVTAILVLVYLLFFYTPFIWILAEPLKISQVPQKANAIVVFAGGVGESGEAGQGYEERVQYAVDLYKQGYAKYMIFSSGYMYVFREPLVMEALAVSLGVPEEAIILEEKAANTYQNVEFSKDILLKKNWNKILLISSPYHMRRVSLVAKKVAPGINIVYTPIPQSRFYRHGLGPKGEKVWKQVNLQQIRGILHEYLGIVYYWYKGYI